MIGAPFLVLGLLLVLSALLGARVAGRDRGAVAAFVLSPLHPATWRATAAIVLGFWVELFALVLVLAAFSSGTSLLFVGIGFVIIGLAIEGCRLVARVERWRASLADQRPLLPHAYRPYGSGLRDLLLAVFLDVSRWRDVVYVFVAFPLTVLELVVSVGLWTASLLLLSVPVWYATVGPAGRCGDPGATAGRRPRRRGLVGLALAPVAASVSQGLMALHRAVVAGLLCDSERRALERRVETLEGSRKAVIDVEASELRRIERDLHDGAQQRLVMLTIDLSLAAERIDTDPGRGPRAGRRGPRPGPPGACRAARPRARHRAGDPPGPRTGPGAERDRGALPGADGRREHAAGGPPAAGRDGAGGLLRRRRGARQRGQARVRHALRDPLPARRRAALVVEVWDDGAGGARVVRAAGWPGWRVGSRRSTARSPWRAPRAGRPPSARRSR